MDLSKEMNGNVYLHNDFGFFNLPINATLSNVGSEFNRIEAIINLNDLSKTELLDIYQNITFQILPITHYSDYLMKSFYDDKIHKKIIDFLEDIENQIITSAKRYSYDIQNELGDLDSSIKDDLSDGFVISLDDFVVTQIINSIINGKILSKNDLKNLIIRTACRYATNKDTKEKIDNDIEFFTQHLLLLEILADGGIDLNKISCSSSRLFISSDSSRLSCSSTLRVMVEEKMEQSVAYRDGENISIGCIFLKICLI